MSLTRCAACYGVPGTTHTCEGSGLALAEEAHEAGAVAEAEPVVVQEVTVTFCYRGSTSGALYLADWIGGKLEDQERVSEYASAVVTR